MMLPKKRGRACGSFEARGFSESTMIRNPEVLLAHVFFCAGVVSGTCSVSLWQHLWVFGPWEEHTVR